MRKKVVSKKKKKEQYRFLAVLLFFLLCGIGYSLSFHQDKLELGREIAAEELIKPMGKAEETELLINLNTASAAELMMISGIGEKRAADIIAYRDKIGGFSAVEDIMQVSGIGEKTFQQIRDQITVDGK